MAARFSLGILTGLMVFVFLPFTLLYSDEIGELKDKVRIVQEENRLLQEKLKNQEELVQELMSRLEDLEEKEAGEVFKKKDIMPSLSIPEMEIKGFGDIGFTAQKADNRSDANPSTFALGELDFIVSSQISEKISVFGENVIEFESATTEIDVERLYLKYSLSDMLNIVIGRFHTPLGYWNNTFHHGKWFQVTDSRPLIMDFEHHNGIMPMHSVGIDFSVKKDIGLFALEYNFDIINGRGDRRTRVQNMQDGNDAKAFNSLFTLKPHSMPGLRLGFNSYIDKIPQDATTAGRAGEINERIFGGYFAYLKNNFELIFEGFEIKHDDEVSQRSYDTTGLYLQTSYRLKEKWTPYYRFDFLDFEQGDPYYTSNTAIDIDNKKHTLGLRWDLSTWNALKLEYSYNDRKGASDKHSLSLNNSFHF